MPFGDRTAHMRLDAVKFRSANFRSLNAHLRVADFSGLGNTPPLGNRRRLVEQGAEGVMTFGDRRLLDQARLPLLSSSSFPLGPLELRSSRKTVV